MNQELKPCPFCGYSPCLMTEERDQFSVRCPHCRAQSNESQFRTTAIAAWNQRHTPTLAITPQPSVSSDLIELENWEHGTPYDPDKILNIPAGGSQTERGEGLSFAETLAGQEALNQLEAIRAPQVPADVTGEKPGPGDMVMGLEKKWVGPEPKAGGKSSETAAFKPELMEMLEQYRSGKYVGRELSLRLVIQHDEGEEHAPDWRTDFDCFAADPMAVINAILGPQVEGTADAGGATQPPTCEFAGHKFTAKGSTLTWEKLPEVGGAVAQQEKVSEEDPWLAIEIAWGIIANASRGDWSKEHPEWVEAAERWRDQWVNKMYRAKAASPSSSTP